MDIGTGKDLYEYKINNKMIPYHLIDILNPQQDYSIHQFKEDFYSVYNKIINKKNFPILCGGSGLYLESILLNYQIPNVPPDNNLRLELQKLSLEKLQNKLKKLDNSLYDSKHHITKRRIIRTIEVYNQNNINHDIIFHPPINDYCVFGIKTDRDILLKRIKKRLDERLNDGMIEEVEQLIKKGITLNRLKYFGLEYKFLGEYLFGNISFEDMVCKLNIAINRFSKRQMTFFRRMEKRGIKIKWIQSNDLPIAKQHIKDYL
jgi:tRNA dimethylallyltransferase